MKERKEDAQDYDRATNTSAQFMGLYHGSQASQEVSEEQEKMLPSQKLLL